uniref:Uncharacterized protein n=1 Tax=Rhizophora mucronata TaxID=61149 RepID=A0A2P2MDB7_RHIMU
MSVELGVTVNLTFLEFRILKLLTPCLPLLILWKVFIVKSQVQKLYTLKFLFNTHICNKI